MFGNLVHPFRNVLFGVGIFVGFWWFFWLVFKFFFFYSVRLKTINPSLTIYAMLQTELPDQDSIVFNQKEKGRAYRTPLLLTQLIPLCLGQFFSPCDCPTRVESKSIDFDILGCIGVRISCSWGQIPIFHRLFLPKHLPCPGFPRSCPVSPSQL